MFLSVDDPPAPSPTWDFFELGNFFKWNDPPPTIFFDGKTPKMSQLALIIFFKTLPREWRIKRVCFRHNFKKG